MPGCCSWRAWPKLRASGCSCRSDPSRLEVHVVGTTMPVPRPVIPGDQLLGGVGVVPPRGVVPRQGRDHDRRAASGGGQAPAPGRRAAGPGSDLTARGGGSGPGAGGAGGRLLRSDPRSAGSPDRPRVPCGDRRRHHSGPGQPRVPLCLPGASSPGPQVPRRGHPARHRRSQRDPGVRHHAAGDRTGRRNQGGRLRQPVHGLLPRGSRLPGGEPHHLRQRGHPGRPRRGGRLHHHRRLLRRPSVLPSGDPRFPGRLHGGHQGRAALLQDGGEPRLPVRSERMGLVRRGFRRRPSRHPPRLPCPLHGSTPRPPWPPAG